MTTYTVYAKTPDGSTVKITGTDPALMAIERLFDCSPHVTFNALRGEYVIGDVPAAEGKRRLAKQR